MSDVAGERPRYPRRVEVRTTFFDTWEVRADEMRWHFDAAADAHLALGMLTHPRLATQPGDNATKH